MPTRFKPRILFSVLLIWTAAAWAGSPGGLNIAVVADPSAAQYIGPLKQFFAHRDEVACSRYPLNLDMLAIKAIPRELTSELALGAVADRTKLRKLGKILTGYRDNYFSRGFDGALALEVKDTKLRMYGISAAGNERTVVSTLPVSAAANQKLFDIAACKALASLPVLVEP
jgi:hypothetical protein